MNSSDASSAPEPDLDRLKSDIDTIQSAIGRGLPFGRTDIRFMWLGTVAVLIAGLGYHFGAREGLARFLIALPVYLVGAGYFIFIAIRKKTANATRATEYKYGLIAAGIIFLTFLPLAWWAESIGITAKGFRALLMVFLGVATMGGAFLPYVAAKSYRRTSLLFGGSMLIVLGVILPVVTRDTFGLVIASWATPVFAGLALIMQYFLKRETANGSDPE